ncbi:alpha/beta hydrolase [Nocardia arthritidis]|uniref:Alpha/beta hydrolase fold domain-containing protein n=1 Tax=Nocardia arthritidis TaxID=228602 RepID=A0A6G9YAP5_9NOCA|nr:alpha/beta hydrolase [Nocardia arthritidis]QIS10238.1 alpha/beta hydrolase fold domain-containing protein [Nocardia arthritidis]
MTRSTRTSVPGVPTVPSARSRLAATATEIGLRPLNNAIPLNAPGVWFSRTLIATIMALGGPPIRGTRVSRVRAGAVRGEWVRAPGVEFGRQAVYYIHGSGYVLCSPRTHRGLASQLSRRTGLPVFLTDYRLAPEHRFPAAADDVEAGYRWLLDRYAAKDLVIGCDSAGGHLALDLLIENGRGTTPQPAGVAMFSPLLDLTLGLAAEQERLRRDPVISARAAGRLPRKYTRGLPDDAPRLRLSIPPGTGLPPILVQAGGAEMLSADARALHAMVRAAGGHCDLEIWPGQVHVFQALPLVTPEAAKALDRAADFLRTALRATLVPEKVS